MPRSFNLADLFEIVAETVPDRTALVAGERRISYRELDQRATRLASALRDRGVRRGDNVAIDLVNSIEHMESFFACCKIGALPVNVNYRYTPDELVYIFDTLDVKVLVYGADVETPVLAALPRCPKIALKLRVGAGDPPAGTLAYESVVESGSASLADPERSGDDLSILCTGGTTGMPKGVLWPHKSLFMAALGGGGYFTRSGPVPTPEALADNVRATPHMPYVVISPLMHGAGLWSCLISLYAGSTVVLNERINFDAAYVWDLIAREKVMIMSVVGDAMALPLIQALEQNPGRWNLAQLRVFGNGGAVFSTHLQDRLKALLPGVMINNGLGSSESGAIQGGERVAHGEGFMRYAPRPELAVIDSDMQRVTTPGGEGVLARTGHTPVGYYGDPRKNAETFVSIAGQLWVLTGDRARIDPDGHYAVLGRGNLCIVSGGEKIYPEEVEAAIRRYPAVRDVLVVGQSDERWGEKVAAVIALEPGYRFERSAFEEVCRATLAGYKLPRAVYLVDEVKRSPVGKADYRWAKSVAQQAASVV